MTDPSIRARDAEDDGEFGEAARLYTESGFETLNRADFEPNRTFRVGIGKLARALSCDVRDGNVSRSVGLRRTIAGTIDHVQREATEECLIGLCEEWLGDVHLMTSSSSAREHYEQALDTFRDVPEGKQFSWGMEEEFDYVYWAVEAVLEQRGFTEMERLPALDFERRVETKLELLDEGFCGPQP